MDELYDENACTRPKCAFPGCVNQKRPFGRATKCYLHYGVCEVDGCVTSSLKHYSGKSRNPSDNRHCSLHRTRLLAGNDLDGPPRGPKWHRNNHGYMIMNIYENSVRVKTLLQHRVVMEEHIGRPLEDEENVHHRNGIRHDNRLENLELWSKKQPPGQRAKDLLSWAEEIIALYGPDREKL